MTKFCFAVLLIATVAAVSPASAGIVGTYVNADSTNTTPTAAYSDLVNDQTDGLWSYFHPGGLNGTSSTAGFSVAEDSSVFIAFGASDNSVTPVPVLTTAVTGLNPADTYDVYVVYGAYPSGASGQWGVNAALHGQTLSFFTDTNGTLAESTADPSHPVFEYQAQVGQVSGVSGFSVDAGNLTTGGTRAYYEGVAYQAIATPEPGSLTLLAGGLLGLVLLRRRIRGST